MYSSRFTYSLVALALLILCFCIRAASQGRRLLDEEVLQKEIILTSFPEDRLDNDVNIDSILTTWNSTDIRSFLDRLEKYPDDSLKADAFLSVAYTSTDLNSELAEQALDISYQLAAKLDSRILMAEYLLNKGYYYREVLGENEKCVEFQLEALTLAEGNDELMAFAMGALALNYWRLGDLENALLYGKGVRSKFKLFEDDINYIEATKNIGMVHLELNQPDSAVLEFQKIILEYQGQMAEFGDLVLNAHLQIANIYLQVDDPEQAWVSLKEADKLVTQGDESAIVLLDLLEARAHFQSGNYKSARRLLDEAVHSDDLEYLQEVLALRSKLHYETNNYKAALEDYQRLTEIEDSLRSLDVSRMERELIEKYETEKKEAENLELLAQNAQRDSEIKQQRLILLVVGLLALVLIVSVVFVLRVNSKTNALNRKITDQSEALKEATESKERFFSNITHEFRTPLTLILSPLEKAFESPELSFEKMSQLIKSNHRHASQLLLLVNQLLELNKLESGHMSVKNTVGDFPDFLDQFVTRFQHAAESKQLSFEVVNKNVNGFYSFDRAKWERILSNLLGNALKFTEKGGITVETWEVDKGLALRVSDSGIGIPSGNLGKVFDRFYQVDDSSARAYEGTGIGLALVKELVDLMDGKVQVSSDAAGTSFVVTVPMEKVLNSDVEESLAEALFSDNIAMEEGKDLILVVEDNDELRGFLKEQLAEKWNVLEASNGEKAWEIIQQELPDIVVSDVMMPGISGYELCEKTKAGSSTMHINFIMLTAKASQEAVVSGLERGADDYITKPFHPHELDLRIYNALQQQERLRQHLMQELLPVNVEDVKTAIPHIEDVFLKDMYEYVENNLNDAALTADRLATEMAMSKSTLNRKLRALLDTSSVDFIRDIRLKRSVEFIRAGHSIAETAYSVGFESPSYFTKIFKARYNKTPSEFASELTV